MTVNRDRTAYTRNMRKIARKACDVDRVVFWSGAYVKVLRGRGTADALSVTRAAHWVASMDTGRLCVRCWK